jgi:hypothetical protein
MRLSEDQELTMKMAKVGYESYAAYTGNKSAVTGDDLPTWEELPGNVCNAWFASADGMTKFLASVGPVEIIEPPGDYRSRLTTEVTELRDRLGKLRDFINNSDVYKNLGNKDKLLLVDQEKAMTRYHTILETRLAGS